MCYTHDKPGWQANVLRLVDVFVDGLRLQIAPESAGGSGSRMDELRQGDRATVTR